MSLEHVAVSCNRVSHAVDWSSDGLVAFASGCFVALYNPLSPQAVGAFKTLKGHTDRVNCVAFVRQGSGSDQTSGSLLVSASADKTCILWRKTFAGEWKLSARFEGHAQGIVALAVVQGRHASATGRDLIASAASDSSIAIWERSDGTDGQDKIELVQRLTLNRHHMMALALGYLPNSDVPILFAGGTDMKVHVYVRQGGEFKHMLSLQGHTDWIRSIQIATFTDAQAGDAKAGTERPHFKPGDLMVATASQDRHVRIWKVSAEQPAVATDAVSETAAGPIDDVMQALQNLEIGDGWMQLSTKAHLMQISVGDGEAETLKPFALMFDALLMGHDDWVHSVSWQPAVVDRAGKTYRQPMALITASADKSIMLWEPDTHSEAWVYRARLGEVGGSTLGFYGALVSPDGNAILANGYNGALHIWKRSEKGASTDWEPLVGISGHYASVEGLAWDPSGTFLLSTSADQTTRAMSEWWRATVDPEAGSTHAVSWHEMARPQIHGYDLNCLAFVHKYQFVSGADEKVIRVFDATRTFAQSLTSLTGINESRDVLDQRPVGANLPALGLSNKAVFEGDLKDVAASSYAAVTANPTSLINTLEHPPFEELLLQHTLWPETNKLYGHGYEIVSVAANKAGTLVASACKAAKTEHAVVRLWSTATWKEACPPLSFHSLTVTSIRFSPDDRFVLTAGRDRGWALFNIERALSEGAWTLEASAAKAHARIVWSVSWSPDGSCFATASRDKLVKVWAPANGVWTAVATLKYDEAVTTIDFYGRALADGSYLLAAGLESGDVVLRSVGLVDGGWVSATYATQIHAGDAHAMSVKGLAWRPQRDGQTAMHLASCSEDHSVRLFRFD